jgi:arylsulfatase A-like enzyme
VSEPRDLYSAPPPEPPRPIGERVAQILVAWLALLLADNLFLAATARDSFTGPWEPLALLVVGTPIAAAMLVPVAAAFAMAHWHAEAARYSPFSRRIVVAVAGLLGFAVGWGVGGGRHLADPIVRALFALSVGFLVATAARTAFWPPVRRALRAQILPFGVALAIAALVADRLVLPRLYEAFHVALATLVLLAASTLSRRVKLPSFMLPAVVFGVLFPGIVAAFELERIGDHARLVALERSPVLGRLLGTFASTFPSLTEAPPVAKKATGSTLVGEAARSLDWHDRSILVVTIDALRADHLPFQGYARPTAPNLAALAERGVVFENAIAATPHTSYSVGSLWTGTYLRPLVALGLESDPTTLPSLMKLYGFETAAFFPPAVFYVDGARFGALQESGFGFNYRKMEFADGEKRVDQVRAFYTNVTRPGPRFLWVHLFEPHEPYEPHPAHDFGPLPIDRYDGEIAAADETLGAIVRIVRENDPRAIVVVSADHGEAFGEHGSTHHGTTVHDEQVHVPLVVEGEGIAPRRVPAVVQTIDIAPTIASALGMPRPPRFRGRDLGPFIAGTANVGDEGFAWAETEDRTLLARGTYRLVCARKERACALFDHRDDAGELHDKGQAEATLKQDLRALARQLEADHGRYEAGAAQRWPEALRRVAQGDREALDEALPLLDDVKPELRSALADACLRMKDAHCTEPLVRALAKESDRETRARMALALAELEAIETPALSSALAGSTLLAEGHADVALAARGDADAGNRLVKRAQAFAAGTAQAEEGERRRVLAALGQAKPAGWVEALEANLDDVRLRDTIVPALAKSGLWSMAKRIAALLEEEREPALRLVELDALEALRAPKDLEAGVRFVAGLPEPAGEALERGIRLGYVKEGALGCVRSFEKNGRIMTRAVGTMKRGPWRILAKGTAEEGSVPSFELDGEQRMPMTATADRRDVFYATPPVVGQAQLTLKPGPGFRVEALWLVPATQDPALAKRAKKPESQDSCTEDAVCAKAAPAMNEDPPAGGNPHQHRVDPARKAAAEGAARAQKQKNAAASAATEAPRKGTKVKTPKSTRPTSADKNETKP